MAGGVVAEPYPGARLGGPELLLGRHARVGGARRHSNIILYIRELLGVTIGFERKIQPGFSDEPFQYVLS